MKGVIIIFNFNERCDFEPIRSIGEREHELERIVRKDEGERCERHPFVCCTPGGNCVDVEVKAFGDIRKACDPCKRDEAVFCFKVRNLGPAVATNVVLKVFFCPAPRKICVLTEEENARINFKNGILTVTFDRIRVCETVDVEVTIIERCESRCPDKFFEHEEHCEREDRRKEFEAVAFVEAREEDICPCNNVAIAFTGHKHPHEEQH